LKIEKVVSKREWLTLPARVRGVPSEIHRIVDAVAKSGEGSWVVLNLDSADRKRLQTIKRQIARGAVAQGLEVRMEMRGGSLGVQKA